MNRCNDSPTWRQALEFFFHEYLPQHRDASPNTQQSYATALRLLLHRSEVKRRLPHQLQVTEVFDFLQSLESKRANTAATRNLRLAALRSFWKAMLLLDHSHRRQYEHLLRIPFKRSRRRSPDYLEPDELARVFQSVDARARNGFRALTLLRYLYNTGSRISEVAGARMTWLSLTHPPEVTIRGKGGKCRVCPLWPTTAEMLRVYMQQDKCGAEMKVIAFIDQEEIIWAILKHLDLLQPDAAVARAPPSSDVRYLPFDDDLPRGDHDEPEELIDPAAC